MFEREGATVVRAPALLEQAIDASPEIGKLDRHAGRRRLRRRGVPDRRRRGARARRGGASRPPRRGARRARPHDGGRARAQAVAALNRRGVAATVTVPEPWTTRESIETLRRISLAGTRVALVHYGERSAPLADAIVSAGASLDELCVYEWQMPPDVDAARRARRRGRGRSHRRRRLHEPGAGAPPARDRGAHRAHRRADRRAEHAHRDRVDRPDVLGGAGRARRRPASRADATQARPARRARRHTLRRSRGRADPAAGAPQDGFLRK